MEYVFIYLKIMLGFYIILEMIWLYNSRSLMILSKVKWYYKLFGFFAMSPVSIYISLKSIYDMRKKKKEKKEKNKLFSELGNLFGSLENLVSGLQKDIKDK